MKRKSLFGFLFIVLCIMSFNIYRITASTLSIDENIDTVGAQVRTSGNAGIRFVANVSNYDCTGVTKYGMVIGFGEVDSIDKLYKGASVNGKEVLFGEVEKVNSEGNYYATLYDVPEEFYNQKVSARAYVIKGEEIIYSNEYVVKSLYDVALTAYENGDRSEFVLNVYYNINTGPYNIKYNLNGGYWSYLSKEEVTQAFLKDFYDFVGYEGTFEEFVSSDTNVCSRGTFKEWSKYVGGYFDGEGNTNKLLNANIETDDDNYFFNSSLYKEKWAPLTDWIQEMNGRMYGSSNYFGGSIDFYRYIIDDADVYGDIYGEMFSGYPTIQYEPVLTYNKGDQFDIQTPVGPGFLGWYLNSDLTGDMISSISSDMYGDIELFASWEDVVTYEITFNVDGGTKVESIVVQFGDTVTLPVSSKEGYVFDGWSVNGKIIDQTFVYSYTDNITLKAVWGEKLEDLVINDSTVYYRNTSTPVKIPRQYVAKEEEFRGVWVTSYTGDFSPSSNKNTMMSRLTAVLDKMEEYNMNAIVFHLRATNNAAYKTKMAPIDSKYGTYETFEEWDYLTWFIEECHKRDIEFHAWLNPYRIKSLGYALDASAEDVAAAYADYPLNAASNPDNILMTYRDGTTQGAILNPCKEAVQDYIVDVCLEIMENYDVDAIHFDDYFYAQMSSGVTVLTEPDQDDYEAYINANPNCGYSKSSASNKKQWRRDNVDNFIYKLHLAMTEFNEENKENVQLGIAPTGIYKNGNGSVSSGSNTSGQQHYESYLFCDTKKWVLNEWIDYICPQTYWGFTHSVAGYADVLDWWVKVVEGTDVNLYSGMGIYMSTNYSSAYSWTYDNNYEASLQVLYATKFEKVKGTCIFSYQYIFKLEDPNAKAYNGMMRLKNEYWTEKVPTPGTMADQYLN